MSRRGSILKYLPLTSYQRVTGPPTGLVVSRRERARERETSLGVPVNNLTAAPLGPRGCCAGSQSWRSSGEPDLTSPPP